MSATNTLPQRSFGARATDLGLALVSPRGAVFLLLLSESLRVLIGNQVLGVDITIYGLLLVLFIIYMPKGILGAALEGMGKKKATVSAA